MILKSYHYLLVFWNDWDCEAIDPQGSGDHLLKRTLRNSFPNYISSMDSLKNINAINIKSASNQKR